jgi:hemerythrin superfamily protein
MIIYDLLMQDHRLVMKIMDAIEQVTDPARRKDLFSFMRTELVMHSKAEEEVLYRSLRELTLDETLVESSFDDHHDIERLLMTLQMGSAATPEWMDHLRELRSIIKQHVEKEESDLFHLAQQHYSMQEATYMGIRLMEEKGKLGMENPLTVMSRKFKEMIE